MVHRFTAFLPLILSMLTVSPLAAQNEPAGAFDVGQLVLPIELTQGLVTDRGHPLPYTASVRVYPMVVLDSHGRWRAGGSIAGTYRNPGREFLCGPRLAYQALQLKLLGTAAVELELAVEGLFGTNGGDEIGFEAVLHADGLLRLGLRGARDYSRGQYLIEGVIGFDPFSWFSSPRKDP